MLTTLGRELIRAKLPEKYKGYADQVLDKKTLTNLMTEIAREDPEGYIDVLQDLNNIGQEVVSTYGRDTSLSYADLKVDNEIKSLNKRLRQVIKGVLNDDSLTSEQKEEKIKELGYKYTQKVQDAVFQDNDKRGTSLASQINSGSRGNKTQLMQLQFGNMLMKDALNRDIPYLMIDPFVHGASPMSYWVSASSGRKGFFDVQAATGQAGYLGKQVTAATHRTTIEKEDCGTTDTGVPFPANSTKNVGAVLLRPFHKYPAGTVVTEKMVAEADDDEEMILRSPTTCKCKDGICAKCNGLGENGKFPTVGEYVPLNAARSFVEPVTQGGISCLHPGTQVRMADWSIKALRDIRVGDRVMGVHTDGSYEPALVTRTFDNGIVPMYLTKFRRGYKTKRIAALASTTCHKMLLITQRTNCKEAQFNNIPRILPVGKKVRDVLACHITSPVKSFSGVYEPAALFLGLMAGNGCCTAGVRYAPHFSCADPSLIEDTEEYMKSIKLRFSFHKGSQCYWRVSGLKVHTAEANPAKALLKEYGMLGHYAHEKKAPVGIHQWGTESALAYVAGLISTDGCLGVLPACKRPYVSFASTSLQLVRTVVDLLYKHCGVAVPRISCQAATDRKHALYSVMYSKACETLKLLKALKLYGVKEIKRNQYIRDLERLLITTKDGEKRTAFKRISQEYIGDMQSLDIEIDNDSHLFLLANGLVVSNSKHGAGIGGKRWVDPEGPDQPHGFRALERLFMAPSNFPGGAVLAPQDGTVSNIQKASQGGHYITVGNKTLYCSPDRTMKVKVGDKVSAGDVLTNGVPNPAEVMDLKGLGEGRHYFANKLNETLKAQGWATDRRNIEAFTRSMISKVKITDPDGYKSYLPGDIADYNEIMADWEPREGSVTVKADQALNKYLEKPTLYFSVGTRITPSVVQQLKKYKFDTVTVSDKEPPFKAQFLRPAVVLQNDKNWLPRLAGERLQPALFDAAQKGITDEYDSPSYVDKIVAAPFKP